jgi:hypothetical protein
LLHPDAPKVDLPESLKRRIEKNKAGITRWIEKKS